MYFIDPDTKEIDLTRGNICVIEVSAVDIKKNRYTFKANDVVRINVYTKKDYTDLQMTKDVVVLEDTTKVDISLSAQDTTIGNVINKPTTYWYEIILNPDTNPQTLVGYDKKGSKKFVLFPKGVESL